MSSFGELKKQTCLVVMKNRCYLSRTLLSTGTVLWSNSLYEAWRTRSRKEAEMEAKRYGGTVMLFNPVIGKVREACFTK